MYLYFFFLPADTLLGNAVSIKSGHLTVPGVKMGQESHFYSWATGKSSVGIQTTDVLHHRQLHLPLLYQPPHPAYWPLMIFTPSVFPTVYICIYLSVYLYRVYIFFSAWAVLVTNHFSLIISPLLGKAAFFLWLLKSLYSFNTALQHEPFQSLRSTWKLPPPWQTMFILLLHTSIISSRRKRMLLLWRSRLVTPLSSREGENSTFSLGAFACHKSLAKEGV